MSSGERLQLWRMGEGRLITALGQGFPGEEAGVGGPGVGSGVEWRYVCVGGRGWWFTPGDKAGDEEVLGLGAGTQNSVQLPA